MSRTESAVASGARRSHFPHNFVWQPSWIAPYESLYSVLQKFAWANATSDSGINRLLFGVSKRIDITAWGHPRSLVLSRWMPSPSIVLPPGYPLSEGTLSHFSGKWDHYLASDTNVRFCRSCLQDGYHSPFFQIQGILRCPVHKELLISQCPSCGATTPPFALCHCTFATPFHCGSCGYPLASEFSPKRFAIPEGRRNVIRTCFEPVVRWLAELRCMIPPTACNGVRDRPMGQLSLFKEHRHESIETHLFQVADSLVALPLPQEYRVAPSLPLRTVDIATRSELPMRTMSPRDIAKQIRSERAVFRSIKRYMRRKYLKGHERCVNFARFDLPTRFFQGAEEVTWHQAVCPIAQAFVRWERAYPWGELKKPSRAGIPIRQFYWLGCPGQESDVDNKLFAWEIVSHFHWSSSVATLLARRELARLAAHKPKPDVERPWDRKQFDWTLSLLRLENGGWLLCEPLSASPGQRYKLASLDPAVSARLIQIGKPICTDYRRRGPLCLRR